MAVASSRVGEAEVETGGLIRWGAVLIGAALMSRATGRGLLS
jgi:hypothetical protein